MSGCYAADEQVYRIQKLSSMLELNPTSLETAVWCFIDSAIFAHMQSLIVSLHSTV